MRVIALTPLDLSIAAFFVLAVALLSLRMRLGVTRQLLVAALRTAVQLLLIGLVLKTLFEHVRLVWIVVIAVVMLLVAAREIPIRQKRPFKGWWGLGIGTVSMFVSSFSITLIAVAAIIRVRPWYEPQYLIPLLGMLLGNTMNGIALGLSRLTETGWQQRMVIENRLMLGQNWEEAIGDVRRESVRSGLIPIINSMSVAGLVSLPGMMTGQILAGTPPIEAVKYQILILFLIAAGTGFGTLGAVWMGSRRLFDDRQRLRLDRLKG